MRRIRDVGRQLFQSRPWASTSKPESIAAWAGSVEAVRMVAKKAGWSLDQIDLFELNEAFAVQAVAVIRELGIDANKVNVHGGA